MRGEHECVEEKSARGQNGEEEPSSEPPVTAIANRNSANRFPPSVIARYRAIATATGAMVCLLAMASTQAAADIQMEEAVVIRLRLLTRVQAIVANASAAASVWIPKVVLKAPSLSTIRNPQNRKLTAVMTQRPLTGGADRSSANPNAENTITQADSDPARIAIVGSWIAAAGTNR